MNANSKEAKLEKKRSLPFLVSTNLKMLAPLQEQLQVLY